MKVCFSPLQAHHWVLWTSEAPQLSFFVFYHISNQILSVWYYLSPSLEFKCNLVGLTVRFCRRHILVATAFTCPPPSSVRLVFSPSDWRVNQHFKASVVISNSFLLQRLLTHELWVWFTEVQVGSGKLSALSSSRRSWWWLDNICTVKQIQGWYHCLLLLSNMPFDTEHKLKPH